MARNRSESIADDHKRSGGGPVQKYNVVSLKILERAGIDLFRASDGDNYIRILPPDDDEVMFGRRVFVHYGIGPNQVNVLCPRRTHNQENEEMGKSCPICDLASKFWEKGDEQNQNRAKELFAGERWLFWVVNTADEKSEQKGVMLYDAPKKIKEELTGLCIGRRGAPTIDPSDPEKGRDLLFIKSGKGKTGTSYSSFQLLETEPIPVEWYKNLKKFDDILLWIDENEIKEMIDGLESAPPKEKEREVNEENSNAMPTRSGASRRRRQQAAAEEVADSVKEDEGTEDASNDEKETPSESDNEKKENFESVDQSDEKEKEQVSSDDQTDGSKNALQAKLDAFKNRRK